VHRDSGADPTPRNPVSAPFVLDLGHLPEGIPQFPGVDAKGPLRDVREMRDAPAIGHRVGRRHEGERRDDDLVAGLDPRKLQTDVKGRRPVDDGDGPPRDPVHEVEGGRECME